MKAETIQQLGAGLHAARGGGRLAPIPSFDAQLSVADAYAVQAATIALAGNAVRGWKVTALSAEDQRKFGSDRPVAGPLLDPYVHTSLAVLPYASFLSPLLECEVAFVLGSDLPQRPEPYRRSDIEAAISSVMPVFEIVDARVSANATDLTKLADCMSNGDFVMGTPITAWRTMDLSRITIALSVNGAVAERGPATKILGDPLLAVVALANAQPLAGSLEAGQIVTTGTCTTPLAIARGRYAGDFGPLGQVRADFT